LTEQEKILFEKLKQEVAKTFLKENPALSTDISKWKGDDIVRFQEDLLAKVKGQVSEKWFYNYFRNDIQKLPRIDMLNLLSEYVGYDNWADFKHKHTPRQNSGKQMKLKYSVFVFLIVAVGLFFAWTISKEKTHKIELCFVDESLNPVTDPVNITAKAGKGEKIYQTENSNCIKFKSKGKQLNIEVKSAYYLPKKLKIDVENDYHEKIMLMTDIYALALRHYSNENIDNVKKRKEKLEKLIADDAVIYQQWFGNDKGIEIYTKEEFITQMILPTSLLKNMEILDKKYKNGKIYRLRFKVKQ